jgi:hypothetical protein
MRLFYALPRTDYQHAEGFGLGGIRTISIRLRTLTDYPWSEGFVYGLSVIGLCGSALWKGQAVFAVH